MLTAKHFRDLHLARRDVYRCFPHQLGGDVCRKKLYFDRIQRQEFNPKDVVGGSGLLLAFPVVGVGILHRFDRGVLLFPRTDVFVTHGYPKISNWTNLGSRG